MLFLKDSTALLVFAMWLAVLPVTLIWAVCEGNFGPLVLGFILIKLGPALLRWK